MLYEWQLPHLGSYSDIANSTWTGKFKIEFTWSTTYWSNGSTLNDYINSNMTPSLRSGNEPFINFRIFQRHGRYAFDSWPASKRVYAEWYGSSSHANGNVRKFEILYDGDAQIFDLYVDGNKQTLYNTFIILILIICFSILP